MASPGDRPFFSSGKVAVSREVVSHHSQFICSFYNSTRQVWQWWDSFGSSSSHPHPTFYELLHCYTYSAKTKCKINQKTVKLYFIFNDSMCLCLFTCTALTRQIFAFYSVLLVVPWHLGRAALVFVCVFQNVFLEQFNMTQGLQSFKPIVSSILVFGNMLIQNVFFSFFFLFSEMVWISVLLQYFLWVKFFPEKLSRTQLWHGVERQVKLADEMLNYKDVWNKSVLNLLSHN